MNSTYELLTLVRFISITRRRKAYLRTLAYLIKMNSAYECTINIRSFHRTRKELSSELPNQISEFSSRYSDHEQKSAEKKFHLSDFYIIHAIAEIFKKNNQFLSINYNNEIRLRSIIHPLVKS